MTRVNIQKGERFGRLRYICDTIDYIAPSRKSYRQARFRCDCGKSVTILLTRVRQGFARSCGCLVAERNRQRGTHGLASTSHPDHSLYQRWYSMHERCYNPANVVYAHYGGRGIHVAKVWHGEAGLRRFVTWAKRNGYQPKLQIDRQNNEGPYAPNNCRWITRIQNMSNRRNTLKISHPETGQYISFLDWFRECPRDYSYSTAYRRLKQGTLP